MRANTKERRIDGKVNEEKIKETGVVIDQIKESFESKEDFRIHIQKSWNRNFEASYEAQKFGPVRFKEFPNLIRRVSKNHNGSFKASTSRSPERSRKKRSQEISFKERKAQWGQLKRFFSKFRACVE